MMKREGRKIVAVTAYDRSVASIVDAATDVVLVGDSVGNVFQGLQSTVPVTMADMIYHARAVSRGIKTAHLCVDMPFLSYQASERDAIRNAGSLLKRGGAESVKIEAGIRKYAKTVGALTDSGIPVVAHVGLCPQSVNLYGGYKARGCSSSDADEIYQTALACQKEGAVAIVIECVPPSLALRITSAVDIPTIGIGSGPGCDGQILVFNDLVGLSEGPVPSFVKKYAEAKQVFTSAVEQYASEVRNGEFPANSRGKGDGCSESS